MKIHRCERCGHEWASRKLTRPDRCAKCVAKYWWRKARVPKPQVPKKKIGKPNKYPIHLLNIGESMTLERDGLNVLSMKQSVGAFARRHGRRFEMRQNVAGYKIKRLI